MSSTAQLFSVPPAWLPQSKQKAQAPDTVVAPVAPAPPSAENRNAVRHPASAFPTITGLRISPHGADAVLVNMSTTGLLAECGERLQPGSAVTVSFDGTFTPKAIGGRVARSTVASVGGDGRLRYHVGITFTRPIVLNIAAVEASHESGSSNGPTEAAGSEVVKPKLVVPAVRNRW